MQAVVPSSATVGTACWPCTACTRARAVEMLFMSAQVFKCGVPPDESAVTSNRVTASSLLC